MPSDVFSALGAALAHDIDTAAIFADGQGYVRFWNDGASALFGHAAEGALGRRVDLIVTREHREAHWIGFERAVRSPWRGSAAWDPIEALHANGDPVALEVFLLPVGRTEGRLSGVLALFRPRADPSA